MVSASGHQRHQKIAHIGAPMMNDERIVQRTLKFKIKLGTHCLQAPHRNIRHRRFESSVKVIAKILPHINQILLIRVGILVLVIQIVANPQSG